MLTERAGLLVGLTVATLLSRMARPEESVVAVTGSLYRLHPTLGLRLTHYTSKLTRFPFSYRLCQDGSGKGAGLVAAIASRLAGSDSL